jgi:protein-disulfide isomerase
MSQFEARLVLPVGDRDHTQGSAAAAVTLVEYGDYQCPYCGQAYPIVKSVQEQMGESLRFVFRNFPISTAHPHAQHAAEAAETAAEYGKFWEMHDALYEHQSTLKDSDLRHLAESVGVDADAFDRDMVAHRFADRVQEDFMSGVRSGVNGTPTFFINGVRYDGSWDPETLLDALQQAAR